MILSHKCSCGPCLIFFRSICVHPVLECNHYKALGLSSSATLAEIKSSYYELSKKYHPDKNQGSEKSAEKFRDITAAYKVLGNEKLRKLYDQEQLHVRNFESEPGKPGAPTDYSDVFEQMYYERRKQSPRKYAYGRTKYYDFDAWYRAHYIDYVNQKYCRYNNKSHSRRMYQDPYYKNSSEFPKKIQVFNVYYLIGLLTSVVIYFCLKMSMR